MKPTAPDNTDWTVIFLGSEGERSSMYVSMTQEKLVNFIKELKPKVIDNLAYWNEVGEFRSFKPTHIFYAIGHLIKKEQIKNAKPS